MSSVDEKLNTKTLTKLTGGHKDTVRCAMWDDEVGKKNASRICYESEACASDSTTYSQGIC